MKIQSTDIPGVFVIIPKVFRDERGFFKETYNAGIFEAAGIATDFVQNNHSGSKQGVLRGLHYQIRHPQGKLVRAATGEVFDVAVDLRQSSDTFAQWYGAVLSAENHHQLWIPPGFGHGFLVLSEWADVVYSVTEPYTPEWDRTLRWNDPTIGIEWPIQHSDLPLLSPKDAQAPYLQQADLFP
jgi:dTDP-4-dehydrorhamnose 3,5-epimerase